MSFSSASSPRLSLIVLASALLLGGCTVLGKKTPAPLAPQEGQPVASVTILAAIAEEGADPKTLSRPEDLSGIMVPLEIINGGPQGNALTGVKYMQFIRPVAVAARGNDVFVVDAGQEILFKFDRILGTLTPVMNLRSVAAGEVADIYVARDLSFYLVDPLGAQVLQFDRLGRLLQTFKNGLNRPVAVSVDEVSGRVFVADGVYDYILVFSSTGQLLGSAGGRGSEPGQFLNITAMTQGRDGFYIAARVGQRLQVLGDDGRYRYSLPQEDVIFPTAIAVDNDGRVYVGDFSDNAIKIYGEGRLLGRLGMAGAGLGEFRHITDLWLDEGLLFVADSMNGRIQVMRVIPVAQSQPPN